MAADQRGATVRPEEPRDREASLAVERAAFGDDDVVRIVVAVRDLPGSFAFVAERKGEIVGHVQFSAASIGEDAVTCLGPIGVAPAHQGLGIGRALIEVGIPEARRRHLRAVILLGDPALYDRFGFEPAARYGLRNPYAGKQERGFIVAEEDLQLLALDERAGSLSGIVRWHAAFGPPVA